MVSDEEIRELSRRVATAESTEQLKAAIAELRIALREHVREAENTNLRLMLKIMGTKSSPHVEN